MKFFPNEVKLIGYSCFCPKILKKRKKMFGVKTCFGRQHSQGQMWLDHPWLISWFFCDKLYRMVHHLAHASLRIKASLSFLCLLTPTQYRTEKKAYQQNKFGPFFWKLRIIWKAKKIPDFKEWELCHEWNSVICGFAVSHQVPDDVLVLHNLWFHSYLLELFIEFQTNHNHGSI